MADERNVIEIILRARDETAGAFAALAAKMGLQEQMAKRNVEQNKELEQSYRNLEKGTLSAEGSFTRLAKSYGEGATSLRRNVELTKEVADAHVRVEQSAARLAKTMDEENHSIAQQEAALASLKSAEADLSKVLGDQIENHKRLTAEVKNRAKAQTDAYSQRVGQSAKEVAMNDEQAASIERIRKIDDQLTIAAKRNAEQRERAVKQEEDNKYAVTKRSSQLREDVQHKDTLSQLAELAKVTDAFVDNEKKRTTAQAAALKEREREEDASNRRSSASAKVRRDAEAGYTRAAIADVKQLADENLKASRQADQLSKNRAAAASLEEKIVQRAIVNFRQYQQEIQKAARLRQQLTEGKLSGSEKLTVDLDVAKAEAQAKTFSEALKLQLGEIKMRVNLNDTRFKEQVPEILLIKSAIGRDIHMNVDMDIKAAMAKMGEVEVAKNSLSDTQGLSALGDVIGQISGKLVESGGSIASFDNLIRGLATFMIAGFLQPLIVLAGAAAGALLALGSAAIYAGGALAGGLVAGLAQAIPVLGVVALAVYRLTAVFQAAQQSQLAQQQASYKGAAAHQTAAKAANTYQNSIGRVLTAERNLSKARLQARRDLQDMVLAEREAELQARASSLAQQDAAKALAVAIASGGDVQQAQLGVQQANLGAARAQVGLSRSRQDLATGQRQGVAGAPGVVAASQALDQAKRGTDQAGAAADLAANKISAATGKLDFLLGRMSPAERQLFGIVQRFQDVARKAAEDITQPIIKATGTVLNRLIGMFKDPRIVGAMTGLAGEMAKQGLRLFSAFTNPKAINAFLEFIKEAKTNLGPLTDILINVGKIFLGIAQAASPVLTALLGFFDQVTGKWAKFLDTPKGKSTLKEFFNEGTTALIAFLNLGGAIIKLFLAIAGPGGGAKTGIDLLVGATGGINKLADSINSGGKAAKFFHDMFKITKEVIKDLGPLFTSIGSELGKTFTEKGVGSVKGFVNFFAQVVIPALGNFIRQIGAVTGFLGKFLEKNPELAKMATLFLGLALSAGLVYRALGLVFFGPLGQIIKFGKAIVEVVGELGGMEEILAVIGGALEGLVWPIAIGAAIVFLLAKFGLLSPIIDAVKDGFEQIVKIAGPPFRDLIKQVERLWDAFGKGKGAFAILKPILSFLVSQVLIREIKALAAIIGNVLGGAFKIIAGAIGLVVDILTGRWSKAWGDVKKIFSGLAQIATAGIRGLLAAFGDLPKKVLRFFENMITAILKFLGIESPSKKFLDIGISLVNGLIDGIKGIGGKVLGIFTSGFNTVFTFLRNLPGRLKDLAGKAVDALIGVFSGVGSKIITAVISGGASAFNFAGQLVKTIAKVIDKAIPDSIHMPDPLPNIDLPNNPLKDLGFYAQGGRVGQGSGGGDRIPALLEAGEHIFSKDEVAAIGGHGVLFALRRMLGGGGQGGGGRFQAGGAATAQAKPGMNALLGVVQIQAEEGIKQLVKFSDDFQHVWNVMWNRVQRGANAGSNNVIEQLMRLRDQGNKLVDQLTNHIAFQFDWVKNRAVSDANQLVNQVSKSIDNLENAVYKGMSYVGNTTNDALKAFNAKPIQLNVQAPGKAGGGWIGQPGERGRDRIGVMLGRGEAVLNWGHQRLVEPALRAAYGFGLGEMFNRTRGFHAGGPGGGGFAEGGFTGPQGSGAAFTPIANFALSKFGLQMTAGRTDHSTFVAGTNRISDHTRGLAGDFSNGILTPQEWAFSNFWKGKLPQLVKQLIFNNQDQFTHSPIGGHLNHVHLAILQQYAFNASKMAAILSRAMRGLNISDLLSGAVGADGLASHIDMPKVSGDQPMVGFLRKTIRKVLDAANSFIDQQASTLAPGAFSASSVSAEGSPAAARRWTQQAMKLAGVSGPLWMNMLLRQEMRESSFNPNSINTTDINAQHGDPSRGIMQTIGATFRAYMLPGHGNILNPVDNIAAAIRYIIATYGHGNPAVGAQVMWNRGGGAYARGGFVGSYDVGGELPGFAGQPIPIIAHAKEWVVNPSQQSKIARWLGTSRDRLKGALGFTGGPSGFAGGGEPLPTSFSTKPTARDLQLSNLIDLIAQTAPGGVGNYTRLVARVNTALRKFSTKVGDFFKGVNTLAEQDGIFDQLSAAIDARVAQLQTGLDLARTGIRRVRARFGATRFRAARPLTETQGAQSEYNIADANVAALSKERGELRDDLQRTNKRIADLRKGGITKKERDVYEQLLGSRNKFLTDLDAADAKVAAARADRFDKAQALFQAQTTAALRPSAQRILKADQFSRIGQALGNTDMIARTSDTQIAALKDQQAILQKQYTAAANKAKRDPRWQAVADDLLSQLRDATASIVEAQATALQNQIDVINNRASRAQAGVDIRNRLADVQERMGDPVGAAQARLGAMQTTGGILSGQVAGLQGALAVARQEKNIAAIDSLTDQINDLNTQIVENTAAMSDQTVAVRQATLDQIQGRTQFQTGALGGLGSLLQTIATNLNTDTSGGQATILQQTGAVLQQGFDNLAQQLFGGFGLNVQGLSGMSFVEAISKLNFDSIESAMTEAQRSQFEALIQALIDSQNAIASNTNQLDTLTGTLGQAQGFSSTAWQWLRMAVFTGAGDLMPQFQVPSMQSGGYVTRKGLFNLHAGEFVVNPSNPSQTGTGGGNGDINVTVHEAGPETDYTYLANRIAFATRTPST